MIYTIHQNNLICPDCKGLMCKRKQDGQIYLFCVDCMKILKVVGSRENELITTEKDDDTHNQT